MNFGLPQTSFCETIDEQSAIVPAQIAEVRIWKNFSLTWTLPLSSLYSTSFLYLKR